MTLTSPNFLTAERIKMVICVAKLVIQYHSSPSYQVKLLVEEQNTVQILTNGDR